MMIDSGETQILEWTLTEGLEQLALGMDEVDLTGGDLAEQRFQLRRIHECRGGKEVGFVAGSELDANIIDSAK